MRFQPRDFSTGAVTLVLLVFLEIVVWPSVGLAQVPQGTPLISNPDDPVSAFGDTNKAMEAAAQGIPGSVEIAAPSRESSHPSHEKMIMVDPAKERKARENAFHDPTFDGSGLFADIKPPPTATPAARIIPAKSTTLNAGGSLLADPKQNPFADPGPSESSSPAPKASPRPSPAESPTESPSPSPSASPSASPQN
jgi:hypothetical protein